MAEVDMGLNLYEYNEMIIKQLPIIEGEGLTKVKETLIDYIVNAPFKKYLMMFCKEEADYTLFNFSNGEADVKLFSEDILECFENREVGIVSCEIIDNEFALEIWVKKPGQMEKANLYYIFPADEMVIEY